MKSVLIFSLMLIISTALSQDVPAKNITVYAGTFRQDSAGVKTPWQKVTLANSSTKFYVKFFALDTCRIAFNDTATSLIYYPADGWQDFFFQGKFVYLKVWTDSVATSTYRMVVQ